MKNNDCCCYWGCVPLLFLLLGTNLNLVLGYEGSTAMSTTCIGGDDETDAFVRISSRPGKSQETLTPARSMDLDSFIKKGSSSVDFGNRTSIFKWNGLVRMGMIHKESVESLGQNVNGRSLSNLDSWMRAKFNRGNVVAGNYLVPSDFNRDKDFARRSVDLVVKLEVPSVSFIPQDSFDLSRTDVLYHLGLSDIPTCLFTSIESLTASVMTEPDQCPCFKRRLWTIVLLGNPQWASEIITSAKDKGLFDSRVHWVVLVSGYEMPVTDTLPFYRIGHRITWLRWTSQANDWVVLVSATTHEGIITRDVSPSDAGTSLEDILRPPNPEDFFGKTLRVVSARNTFPAEVSDAVGRCYYLKDGRTTVCTGYVGELLTVLAKSLNVTINNREVRKCGLPGANGTRVTIIAGDEADISLGTCSITSDRLTVVDFTEFFIAFRSSICSAEPQVIRNPLLILSVFTWDTWLTIVAYLVVVGLVLWIVSEIVGSVADLPSESPDALIFFVYKALVYQGHKDQPKSVSGRGVVATSWVVIITLAGIYSGNLTAWLSIPRYERPVNSLSDLVEREDLIPFVARNDPNHQLFKNKTEGALGAINNRLQIAVNDKSDDFARTIIYGKAVFFNSDRAHFRRATQLNKAEGLDGVAPCRIHLSSQDLFQHYIGFMINKNSWFKDQINRKIQQLRSFGIVKYLYSQFVRPGCRLYSSRDRVGLLQKLSLNQLQGALLVWLVGVAWALVALVFECVIMRH